MAITRADRMDGIHTQGALFMEVPPERLARVHSESELIVIQVQEVIHYLCLIHIIPDELFHDFDELGTKDPASNILFGEIWDIENKRYISSTSFDRLVHKLRK